MNNEKAIIIFKYINNKFIIKKIFNFIKKKNFNLENLNENYFRSSIGFGYWM